MNKFLLLATVVAIVTFLFFIFIQKKNDNLKLGDFAPLPTPTGSVIASPSIPTKEASSSPLLLPTNTKPSRALLRTNKGDILLALYYDDTPSTVENFVKKTRNNFYTNLTFHRVEDWVIQGGDPKGNGTGGGVMPTELNKKPFVTGSLGVARGGDIRISNDAQFFITKKDANWLNEQYTNFGIVVSGMDVVGKIEVGDKILGIIVE